jgi:hypothetical protein
MYFFLQISNQTTYDRLLGQPSGVPDIRDLDTPQKMGYCYVAVAVHGYGGKSPVLTKPKTDQRMSCTHTHCRDFKCEECIYEGMQANLMVPSDCVPPCFKL